MKVVTSLLSAIVINAKRMVKILYALIVLQAFIFTLKSNVKLVEMTALSVLMKDTV